MDNEKFQTLTFEYNLPFPIRIVKGSSGEKMLFPIEKKELAYYHDDENNGGYVSPEMMNYGEVRINYPFFKLSKNEETPRALLKKGSIDTIDANCVKIEAKIKVNSQNKIDLLGLLNFAQPIVENYLDVFMCSVRYRTRQSWIGQRLPSHYYNFSVIYNEQEIPRIDSSGTHIHSSIDEIPLDQNIWTQIKEDILNENLPELYEELLLDADYMIHMGDNRRAILDMAVACEIFVQSFVDKKCNEKGVKCINKKRSEFGFVGWFNDIILLLKGKSFEELYPKEYKDINFLFTARNKLMHEGKIRDEIITIGSGEKGKFNSYLIYDSLMAAKTLICWIKSL